MYMCIYVCTAPVCVHECTHACVHADTCSWESSHPFHHMNPRNPMRVLRLGRMYLNQLSHNAGSKNTYFDLRTYLRGISFLK